MSVDDQPHMELLKRLITSPMLTAAEVDRVDTTQGVYICWFQGPPLTCLKVGLAALGVEREGLRRRIKQHIASDLRSSVLARHLAADRTSEWCMKQDLGDRSTRREFVASQCTFQVCALPDLSEEQIRAFERHLEVTLPIRYIGRVGHRVGDAHDYRATTAPRRLLDKDDVARISYALDSLREFHDGYLLRRKLERSIQLSGPLDKYLMNSEQHYLHAYYMTEPSNGLLPVLRSVGLAVHADHVEAILSRPVGKTTLREIIKGWRNKWLVHTGFTWDRVDRTVMQEYDPADPVQLWQFRTAVHRLYRRTFALYLALRRLAPLETQAQDEYWPPVDKKCSTRRSSG